MRWLAGVHDPGDSRRALTTLRRLMERAPMPRQAAAPLSGPLAGNGKSVLTDGAVALVADCELHNRAELLLLLREAGRPVSGTWSDERLVLEAYRVWDTAMAEHLMGEFAVIVWDASRELLYAARDPLGVRTLFYRRDGEQLCVTSSLRMLVPSIATAELDIRYLRDFLTTDGDMDPEQTPYQGVCRLPRGHWLRADRNGVTLRKYWDLSTYFDRPLRYRNEGEYAEQFHDLLKTAVRCRLPADSPVAVSLSGGLDSSAVFALAKELEAEGVTGPVMPVTLQFRDDREADEQRYVRALLRDWRTEGQMRPADHLVVLKGFPNDAPLTDEPRIATTSYACSRATTEMAIDLDCAFLLTGHGGDHLLTGHPALTGDLFWRGQIRSAVKTVWDHGYSSMHAPWRLLWDWCLGPAFGQGAARQFLANRRTADRQIIRQMRRTNHRDLYAQSLGATALVSADREISGADGVRNRHPFFDRRLWEFMARVPGDLRWRHGTSKYILRQALRTKVSPEILTRTDKAHNMRLLYNGLHACWPLLRAAVEPCRIASLGLVDREVFLSDLERFRQGDAARGTVWTAVCMELWLFRRERVKQECLAANDRRE